MFIVQNKGPRRLLVSRPVPASPTPSAGLADQRKFDVVE